MCVCVGGGHFVVAVVPGFFVFALFMWDWFFMFFFWFVLRGGGGSFSTFSFLLYRILAEFAKVKFDNKIFSPLSKLRETCEIYF